MKTNKFLLAYSYKKRGTVVTGAANVVRGEPLEWPLRASDVVRLEEELARSIYEAEGYNPMDVIISSVTPLRAEDEE